MPITTTTEQNIGVPGHRIDGIPHDKADGQCQAVRGNAEGQVPTTAADSKTTSPGGNPASGAANVKLCEEGGQ